MDLTPSERALLEAEAAEAEKGYDVGELLAKAHPGRPVSVGTEAAVVVPVRLDPARIAALDAAAQRSNTTRSALIREAIDQRLAAA